MWIAICKYCCKFSVRFDNVKTPCTNAKLPCWRLPGDGSDWFNCWCNTEKDYHIKDSVKHVFQRLYSHSIGRLFVLIKMAYWHLLPQVKDIILFCTSRAIKFLERFSENNHCFRIPFTVFLCCLKRILFYWSISRHVRQLTICNEHISIRRSRVQRR